MSRLMAVLFVGLLLPTQEKGSDPHQVKGCDLKRVERGKWCEKCKTIDPKLDEKGNCCNTLPKEVDVCIKTYWACPECKKETPEDKPCCASANKVKKTSKALVVFICEACGAKGDKEGTCANEECKKKGKQIRRTCDKSGWFPHTAN